VLRGLVPRHNLNRVENARTNEVFGMDNAREMTDLTSVLNFGELQAPIS
jgi:hypothetical protein